MVKLPTVEEAFGRQLEFTAEEKKQILSDAEEVIAETLLAFEDFIAHDRQLDPEYWEFVKTHENLDVYRTHADKQHALPPNGAMDGRDYFHAESCTEQFRSNNVPMVISTGRIPGTVEDAALGALGDSEDRTLLRTSYLYPGYHIKHLATLECATTDDPFRFSGLKWCVTTLPEPWRPRDIVFVECTGLALDSNGDRVAYFLMLSVKLPDKLPELPQYELVRSVGMTSFIYRQFDASTVEVFFATFADPQSDDLVEASLNSEHFAEDLISTHTVVEAAYVKKLLWFTIQKKLQRSNPMADEEQITTHCELCGRSFLCDVEEERNEGRPIQGFVCQVCRRSCCSACLLSKDFGGYSSGEEDIFEFESTACKKKPTGCCVTCMLEARNLPAWDIAQATLLTIKC